MFRKTFKVNTLKIKKTIEPEDLLPTAVETTNGDLFKFEPIRMIDSLVKETGLERSIASDVSLSVLRLLGSLDLKSIAAPHLRELICQELTKRGLHEYRNKYTRLGLPIYDLQKLMSGDESKEFKYKWITMQIFEQYLQLIGNCTLSEELTLLMIKNIYGHSESKKEAQRLSDRFSKFKKLYDEKFGKD